MATRKIPERKVWQCDACGVETRPVDPSHKEPHWGKVKLETIRVTENGGWERLPPWFLYLLLCPDCLKAPLGSVKAHLVKNKLEAA